MPRPKRLEKLKIWEPGAASRAGAQRAVGEIRGAGEVRVAGFQNFSFPESGPSEIFGERQKPTHSRPPLPARSEHFVRLHAIVGRY